MLPAKNQKMHVLAVENRMIKFDQFFNESHGVVPFRDSDMYDQAVSDWWGFIERSTKTVPKNIVKVAQTVNTNFSVQGPEQILQFWTATKHDIQSNKEKGPGYVIMVVQRLGGYPDSGYVIEDIDINLVKDWWREWVSDNEGHFE